MWKQGNREGAFKIFRMGKSRAASGDAHMAELQKCLDDAARQLGVNKRPTIRTTTSAAQDVVVPSGRPLDVNDMPPELLVLVFSVLPLRDKLKCLRVCKRWRTAGMEDKRLWQIWDLSPFSKSGTNAVVQVVATRAKGMLKELILPSAKLIDDKGLNWLMIQRCVSLHKLVLRENTRLSPKGLGSVIKFLGSALSSVEFTDVRAADDIGTGSLFRFCTALEELILGGNCPFTPACIVPKQKIPLRKIAILGCAGFNDAALVSLLAACSGTLHEIEIADCQNVSRLSLVNLANTPNLTSISLSKTNMAGPATISLDDALLSLADKCRNLSVFRLGFCPQLTDQGLENLLAFAGQTLTELDLRYSGRLTDAAAQAIGAHCASLRVLNLSWCPRITADGLLDLVQGCRSTLQSLSVAANPNIGDGVVESICVQCANLERIDLARCTAVSTMGASAMLRNKIGKTWKHICLDDCNSIASEVLQLLAKKLKSAGGTISARVTTR